MTALGRPGSLEGDLYLNLLKRVLTGAIYEENDIVFGGVARGHGGWKLRTADRVGNLISRFGVEVAYKRPYDPVLRQAGRDLPARADSMIGLDRMDNLQGCVESVLDDGVPGDLIETGVWRGGAAILMRAVLQVRGVTDRNVWLADSFEGLPAPDQHRYPADAGDTHHKFEGLRVGVEQVKRNFERYDLLDEQVRFIVGWFEQTLPAAPVEELSVLRLDGDMYSSTIQALDALYPKLSAGGYCIVDDYGNIPGCQRAVSDYRERYSIRDEIMDIDGWGAYWRKS